MALVQRGEPGASGAHFSERDDEPVFGLPRREVQGWLAENPTYEPAYEAELAKHSTFQAKSGKNQDNSNRANRDALIMLDTPDNPKGKTIYPQGALAPPWALEWTPIGVRPPNLSLVVLCQ